MDFLPKMPLRVQRLARWRDNQRYLDRDRLSIRDGCLDDLSSMGSVQEVVTLFFYRIVARFSMPASLISDCQSKFKLSFWTLLYALASVKLRMSTLAYLQTRWTCGGHK